MEKRCFPLWRISWRLRPHIVKYNKLKYCWHDIHNMGKNIIPAVTEILPANKRDHGTRENISSHMNVV